MCKGHQQGLCGQIWHIAGQATADDPQWLVCVCVGSHMCMYTSLYVGVFAMFMMFICVDLT